MHIRTTKGQTVKFQQVTVKGGFPSNFGRAGYVNAPHINAKWNKSILMKYSFPCETTEPEDTQTLCLWTSLWSEFMFAIKREGEHFSFHTNAVNERVWEHLHTQSSLIVYIYIYVRGSLCEHASAFMYNSTVHYVTSVQFGGPLFIGS